MNIKEADNGDCRNSKDPNNVACASLPKCEYELESQWLSRSLESLGSVRLVLQAKENFRGLWLK